MSEMQNKIGYIFISEQMEQLGPSSEGAARAEPNMLELFRLK